MKRYELVPKEEIIEFVMDGNCTKCEIKKFCDDADGNRSCSQVKAMYLNQEIEMKPRWATIKSNEDGVAERRGGSMNYLKIPVDDEFEIGDCALCPFSERTPFDRDECLIGSNNYCILKRWDGAKTEKVEEKCKYCQHRKKCKQQVNGEWKWFDICDLLLNEEDGWAIVTTENDRCEMWKEIK